METTFDYKLDGNVYKVLVVKKNNKNTYIKIKDDLTIYVTTNYLTSKREVKTMLDNENKISISGIRNGFNERIYGRLRQ